MCAGILNEVTSLPYYPFDTPPEDAPHGRRHGTSSILFVKRSCSTLFELQKGSRVNVELNEIVLSYFSGSLDDSFTSWNIRSFERTRVVIILLDDSVMPVILQW